MKKLQKILGIPRKLLDITLADLHIKDLVAISSDKCKLLQKGEMALINMQRVEKSQDIMKDIYMDALKGSIIYDSSKYPLLERVWVNDNKLETSIVCRRLDSNKKNSLQLFEKYLIRIIVRPILLMVFAQKCRNY